MNEMKSLTLNGKTYDSFPDKKAVKTINGEAPDENGNVEVKILEGGAVATVEPMDNDVPQVYLTGVDGVSAPASKNDGEVNFKLHYVSKSEEFTAYCTLKLQGDSSANTSYKKKNYTMKMFSDPTHETKLKKEFRDWGFSTNKYILKANWIDATNARQMVAYDIWSKIVKTREGYADSVEATLPNQGTSDGFPVVVYINDTYFGIYTWILPKSNTLFGVDEDDANQFVIYGQTNTDGKFRKTANNFRALWSGRDVDNWEIEVGTNSDIVKTAVNNFTNFVMTATDEEFHANLGNYCNVNSLIDGYLFDYYLCGIDALAQNMILICRDGATFTLGVWDRDSTFGLWWDGSRILPTTYRCPEDYQERYSLLWARLEGTFYNELKARKAELRADGAPLSFGNIVGTFDAFVHNIGDDRYNENNEAYTQPSKSTATKKQFREFVRDRLAYVDSCVDAFGIVIKCADISLSDSSLNITGGNRTLTAKLVPSATTQEVTWTSSDESIVTVQNGVITPVKNGSVNVTATCGQYSATCAVTVDDVVGVPCTGISLSTSELAFTEIGMQTITATVTPNGCTDEITWESNNTDVATVNGGVVTAVANGNATITAKCGNHSATCSVSVSGIEGIEDIDYTKDALADVTWEPGIYNHATGEPSTSNGTVFRSSKFTTQNSQYAFANLASGKVCRLHIWNSDGAYCGMLDNAQKFKFILHKDYAYALDVYDLVIEDVEKLTYFPVQLANTSESITIDLASLTWVMNDKGYVEATLSTKVDISKYARCNFPIGTQLVKYISNRYDKIDYVGIYESTILCIVNFTSVEAITAYLAENPVVIELS